MTKNNITPVEQELLRFFTAGKAYQMKTSKSVFMPACIVDETWHSLLNEEERYFNLTSSIVGSNIEHVQSKGFGEIEWVADYEKMFGKLSKEWFTSVDGTFNLSSYDEYLKKGKMYASWDCSPAYKPIKKDKPVSDKKTVAVC